MADAKLPGLAAWRWKSDDITTLRKLVSVAEGMTGLAQNEYACRPDDFADEWAAVKAGAELLARVESSERTAACPDCGAELTWPLGQEKPWPCGSCNEDQS